MTIPMTHIPLPLFSDQIGVCRPVTSAIWSQVQVWGPVTRTDTGPRLDCEVPLTHKDNCVGYLSIRPTRMECTVGNSKVHGEVPIKET